MERIRAKILAIGRMNKMLKTLRDNQEKIVKIKESVPNKKMPMGTLISSETVEKAFITFHERRNSDASDGFPLRSRRLSLKTREMLNLEAM